MAWKLESNFDEPDPKAWFSIEAWQLRSRKYEIAKRINDNEYFSWRNASSAAESSQECTL